MKEIVQDADGKILGVPKSRTAGHDEYRRRQDRTAEKVRDFVAEHGDVIQNVIGRRIVDLDNMAPYIVSLAEKVLDRGISRQIFRRSVKQVLDASSVAGRPELSRLMIDALQTRVWCEIPRIKDFRLAKAQGYVPGQ